MKLREIIQALSQRERHSSHGNPEEGDGNIETGQKGKVSNEIVTRKTTEELIADGLSILLTIDFIIACTRMVWKELNKKVSRDKPSKKDYTAEAHLHFMECIITAKYNHLRKHQTTIIYGESKIRFEHESTDLDSIEVIAVCAIINDESKRTLEIKEEEDKEILIRIVGDSQCIN